MILLSLWRAKRAKNCNTPFYLLLHLRHYIYWCWEKLNSASTSTNINLNFFKCREKEGNQRKGKEYKLLWIALELAHYYDLLKNILSDKDLKNQELFSNIILLIYERFLFFCRAIKCLMVIWDMIPVSFWPHSQLW